MASAAASLLRAGTGDEARIAGVVRVTASEIVGVEVLPPILTRLRAAHPRIDIELELSNAVTDLLRRDADIAVRMIRPKQAALVARRVGRIQVGLHAHRRYLDAHGMPASIVELAQHTLIGFDRPPAFIKALKLGVELTRDQFAFRADNDLAQLAAIRAGFGIGFCQYGLARRDPALAAVLPGVLQFDLDTYIVMHADQRKAKHIKFAFDAIHQAMSEYAVTSRA
jgi:DNA-binding transcriptional LysR family regulator